MNARILTALLALPLSFGVLACDDAKKDDAKSDKKDDKADDKDGGEKKDEGGW